MAHSQNGWSAGTSSAIGGLYTTNVPGTQVRLPRGVRRGDVATVLLYVAERPPEAPRLRPVLKRIGPHSLPPATH
jgi:hypothetical protein